MLVSNLRHYWISRFPNGGKQGKWKSIQGPPYLVLEIVSRIGDNTFDGDAATVAAELMYSSPRTHTPLKFRVVLMMARSPDAKIPSIEEAQGPHWGVHTAPASTITAMLPSATP